MPPKYHLDTSVCNDCRKLYQSRLNRSILQEVEFLLNIPLKYQYLDKRLFIISYARGTIRHRDTEKRQQSKRSKIVTETLTFYITYKPESKNPVIAYKQFSNDDSLPTGPEYQSNRQYAYSKATSASRRGKQLICSICSEDSTRWVLEKVNNYLISQESQMCLTLGVDQSFKQEEWITKENVK